MKHILHRFYKGAIILAGIGVILLATLYLLRSVLIASHIQRFLENSIQSQLGMEVAIGNIGGSYVTDFEVANVTTLKPVSAGILVSLELKRLRVSYNLLSSLKGLNAFLGDVAVDLEAAKLEFDKSREDVNPPVQPEADSVAPIFLSELLPEFGLTTHPYFCGDRIMRRHSKNPGGRFYLLTAGMFPPSLPLQAWILPLGSMRCRRTD